jgi:DNA-binding NarL/FixJ family response regulator
VSIRLVIVDDQPLVRAGFRMILSAQSDMEVVGEAGDGAQALRLVAGLRAAKTPADIVVMDIRMPVMDGVEATRRLCAPAADTPQAGPGPRVIVLTTFDTDEEAFAALQAGASGFLLKNAPPEELLAAIRVVASGDAVVAPRITRRLLDRFAGQFGPPRAGDPRLGQLTDREREVLLLVAQGRSNAEIAERLVVAETTVKTHVGRILTKLGLRDRVQVVVLADETGLVRPRV